MKRLTLPQYVGMHGQEKVAQDLGLYQGAISKALSAKRNITILVHEDGKVEAEELKPFPSRRYQR
ncbi:Cro/CI family transcriptional regulator [Arsenophonus sp.]|uniref:Cro/CI family transcriptional regulator n=1 Tax=Arsenophonus sp. TaxID=1872640 RepID=UPI0028593993|nr:Cro/CI family transcriptional regulator [Arsenophonus sp.]MDR5616815.1 Cro/CI family transcriptional regulator [Arsenophonus sp.]